MQNKRIFLLKYGELALKGLNRRHFETLLIKNIKNMLRSCGMFSYYIAQSTIVLKPQDDCFDYEKAEKIIGRIFGIAAYSVAYEAPKDIDAIENAINRVFFDALSKARTFKVNAKRSDKRFSMTSPQICAYIGEKLLNRYKNLSVNVTDPELTVTVEIRDFCAFVRTDEITGAGGMPAGSNGRGLLLLSGGIDSPVAGYMMAKRGVFVDGIHFFSYPYTSLQAKDKVIQLGEKLAGFTGIFNLNIINFTKIQEQIRSKCPEELFTVIMRRSMMRISQMLAAQYNSSCLITGESLGQVASQTMEAIRVTDNASDIPVFRPLIGFDKTEIVKISRSIDTFDTSILPYEDCCTVFTPKHPKTKPRLAYVIDAERLYDFEKLEKEAAEDCEYIKITLRD